MRAATPHPIRCGGSHAPARRPSELDAEHLRTFLLVSNHGWQAWGDGYVAGYLASQAALIDRVLKAEADADRYYMMAFNPPQVVRACLSYAELCRRRGDPEAAQRAEQRIARLFPSDENIASKRRDKQR
jgi:hypothetical protein